MVNQLVSKGEKMKKLIFILMVGSLFIGCFTMTMQNLSQSSKVTAGMTTDEVRDIMGEPVLTELDRNVEEWHYCRSDNYPPKDRFLAIYFADNKVIAKTFYTRWKGHLFPAFIHTPEHFGSCEHFVKTGDYKVPSEVQVILGKNTPNPPELKEPKEPIEPEEGVMPTVPDVKIPEIEMNILDGNISSGSTTLKTEDIIKDCKKECVTFTISSDEWCACMHQCSQKVFDKISFGDMNVKIYIEECP